MGDAVEKYLARHAEPCDPLPAIAAARALVIPSSGEGCALLDTLASVPTQGRTLAVVVVNGRADAPDWVHHENQRSMRALEARFGTATPVCEGIVSFSWDRGLLWVMDRRAESHPIPAGEGVGLARKLGTDVCLRLWVAGGLASRFFHCTDADVRLPEDYFERTQRAADAAVGLVYSFAHEGDGAVQAYELWLRYYVLGLVHARSPYAYHSIGSTLAVDATAYAMVRGFPLRQAGEDFYLLNKLAKVGSIQRLNGPPIRLSGRESARTAFGTGRAVGRWQERDLSEFPLYHPTIFACLRGCLRAMDRTILERVDLREALHVELPDYAKRAWQSLCAVGVPAACERALSSTASVSAAQRHLQTFFDAFRTLKFVHHLRDTGFCSVPLPKALDEASFVPATGTMSMQEALMHVAHFETTLPDTVGCHA